MTSQDYDIQLARLAAIDPANLLLNKLRQGFTPVNALLLSNALRNVKQAPPTEQAAVEVEESDDPVGDEKLKAMRVQQRKLFSERARLSDHFHVCRNKTERAANSEEIQIVQRNIERVMKRIRHYKVHGVLPDDETAKNYIPKDGLELAKKINSLRARRSQTKKTIEELRQGNLDDPAQARKLEKYLDKLRELETMLKDAEKKAENLQ